ncbi:hypothetical protein AB0M54_18250 [Actinoplanes sp. NPDC051470]|uniref:hypothetical protein n=1 Tax=Actinoplanes sp. NPDC051470 TaxID=3157224 RepID=UPI003449DC62
MGEGQLTARGGRRVRLTYAGFLAITLIMTAIVATLPIIFVVALPEEPALIVVLPTTVIFLVRVAFLMTALIQGLRSVPSDRVRSIPARVDWIIAAVPAIAGVIADSFLDGELGLIVGVAMTAVCLFPAWASDTAARLADARHAGRP